jgi:hypothetical protein
VTGLEGWLKRIAESPLALAALLALALGVRLYAVYHARFDRDEAASWEIALQIARGERFPTVGPGISRSDAGTPGPLFFYLMALPQLVTAHPLAGGTFVALLNVGALALIFLAYRGGWDAAAAAAWLVTSVCSPWSVVAADRAWTPNLFVPMCAVVLWSAVRMGRVPESRAAAALAFTLLAGFQIHLPALYLWPLALTALAVLRPRINVRWLAAGALAGLVSYAPYLAHELATGFENTRLLVTRGAAGTLSLGAAAGLVYLWLSMATTDVSFLVAQGYWGGFEAAAFWAQGGLARTAAFYGSGHAAALLFAVQAAGWVLLGGGLILLARLRRAHEEGEGRLFACLFAAGLGSILLLYLATRRGGFSHYVSLLAPLASVPLLASLRALARRRAGAVAAAAYLVAAPVAGLLLVIAFYRLDSRQSIPQQERIVKYVVEQSGGRPFELAFDMPEGRGVTYGTLARRLLGARWPASVRARDVFTVVPRETLATAHPPGRVASTLTLDTLAVVHSQR